MDISSKSSQADPSKTTETIPSLHSIALQFDGLAPFRGDAIALNSAGLAAVCQNPPARFEDLIVIVTRDPGERILGLYYDAVLAELQSVQDGTPRLRILVQIHGAETRGAAVEFLKDELDKYAYRVINNWSETEKNALKNGGNGSASDNSSLGTDEGNPEGGIAIEYPKLYAPGV